MADKKEQDSESVIPTACFVIVYGMLRELRERDREAFLKLSERVKGLSESLLTEHYPQSKDLVDTLLRDIGP